MVSPRADRRLAGVVLVLAAAVLALAGAAWTRSETADNASRLIKGTSGSDLLRGGMRGDILEGLGGNDRLYGRGGPDRLYGGAGNDRLFGGPGDDKLAGGPGVDRFSCGRGRDIVYTSKAGGVSRDCEIVHRGAIPAPGLATGSYRGKAVSFQLSADAKRISNLRLDFRGQCSPSGGSTRIQIANSGPWPVNADRTFTIEELSSGGDRTKLSGRLEDGGIAKGTFELQATIAGVACDTGSVSWSAQISK
jgi:hemolysin type calcium-binding protein